jgi:proline dehydrogenase
MSWFNKLIVKILPLLPKSIVWLFSRRYIAGKTLEEGISKTREINNLGCCTTMDVLGEDIYTLEEAASEKEACLRVLDAIQQNGLDGNLSLKLTSLGLRIDKEQCFQNVREIVQKAKKLGNRVRIDMEDATCTSDTLEIYRRLRVEFNNVGTVVQAYLKRTVEDVSQLINDGIANLRICKGIYEESPEIAYKDKEKIRVQFIELTRMMLESDSYICIATHDKPLVDKSMELIQKFEIKQSKYEFQMLLGVTEKMRGEIVSAGHKMRIYVPYGEHWYGYSLRRLKENPKIAGHIIKNLFVNG